MYGSVKQQGTYVSKMYEPDINFEGITFETKQQKDPQIFML